MRWIAELKYAARRLRANPGFALAAVVCLALGIGATSAMFTLIDAVLLKPLPYPEPDQLIRLYTEFPKFPHGGLRRFWVSAPEWKVFQQEFDAFSSVEGWATGGINVSSAKEPLRITATGVTGGLFETLGVQPMLGRWITKADDVKGALPVAVISYGFFQSAFAGDASVLNRVVKIDGLDTNIVGVMPSSFTFPPGDLTPSDAWLPMQMGPELLERRAAHFLNIVGRLKKDRTIAQARAEITRTVALSKERTDFHPFLPDEHPVVAYPLREETVRTVRFSLWMLFAAVDFVLLIACVNVANLLLARAEARQQETAVRRALGAGTWQLALQFAAEGFVLSAAGGVVGLGLAAALVRAVATAGAANIPRASEIHVDWTLGLTVMAVLLFTTVVFGFAPLMELAGQQVSDALKAAGARTTATVSSKRFRSALVAGELALSLMLLITTGLMLRTFWNLADVHLGFEPRGLITAKVELPEETYKTQKDIVSFWQRLEEKLAAIPGARLVGLMSGLPPERPINANDTVIEGFTPVPGGPGNNLDYWQTVDQGFFETLGVRLIDGRYFDTRETLDKNPSAIVNQTMARTYYRNQSPIGKRLRIGNEKSPWLTIVGVVEDVKNAGLDRPAGTELFLPYHQMENARRNVNLVVRASGDPMSLSGAIRAAVLSLDPALPVADLKTMDDVVADAKSRPKFLATLLAGFSLAALVLAAAGLYAVISYSVARRTAEFGIRMAMGASAGEILALVLRGGLKLALAGVVAGTLGAALLTRFLEGLLYGVRAFDPLTFLAMSAVLVLVTLAACVVPARRATQSDPLIALRYE